MDNHVLIISTGNQDLKLICKTTTNCSSPKIELREIGKYNRRLLHKALIDEKVKYKIIANEEALKAEINNNIKIPEGWTQSKKGFIDVNCKDRKLDTAAPFKQDTWENRDKSKYRYTKALQNKKGEYLLFPAKLHTVVKSTQAEDKKIVSGVVFYTDRKNSDELNIDPERKKKLKDQYNSEPIATGKILAKWLEEYFPDSNFQPVNFLENSYAFEGNHLIEHGTLQPYDQPIALRATSIIDTAIFNLSNEHLDATAIVSHTGGIADAKSILTASSRLHFHGKILEIHDSEHITTGIACLNEDNQKHCRILPRDNILMTKHYALQRLWEGDFNGAWAVASHIMEDDPVLQQDAWVQAIKNHADYIEGRKQFERNEIPTIPSEMEENGSIKLLWLVFRIEIALQRRVEKNEPLTFEMLRWINLFREKVLEYLLLFSISPENYPDYTVSLREWSIESKTGSDKFEGIKIKNSHFFRMYLDTGETKIKNINHNLYQTTYEPFSKNIEKDIETYEIDNNTECSLREYRNKLTHRFLPTDDIEKIKQYGEHEDINLWDLTPNDHQHNKLGTVFLDRPLITNIFKKINPNIGSPDIIYRNMVTELMNTIQKAIVLGQSHLK